MISVWLGRAENRGQMPVGNGATGPPPLGSSVDRVERNLVVAGRSGYNGFVLVRSQRACRSTLRRHRVVAAGPSGASARTSRRSGLASDVSVLVQVAGVLALLINGYLIDTKLGQAAAPPQRVNQGLANPQAPYCSGNVANLCPHPSYRATNGRGSTLASLPRSTRSSCLNMGRVSRLMRAPQRAIAES